MMIYRLYTEDIDRNNIINLVSRYYPGFNVREAEGYYKGLMEKAIVIELVAMGSQAHVIRFLAKAIAQMNRQECVLVTSQPCKAEFVS